MTCHTIAAIAGVIGVIRAVSGYDLYKGIGRCGRPPEDEARVEDFNDWDRLWPMGLKRKKFGFVGWIQTADDCWASCEGITGDYTYPYAYWAENECKCQTHCHCLEQHEASGEQLEESVTKFPTGEQPPPYNCSQWGKGAYVGVMSNWDAIQVDPQHNCSDPRDIGEFYKFSYKNPCGGVELIQKPVEQWSLWLVDPRWESDVVVGSQTEGEILHQCVEDNGESKGDLEKCAPQRTTSCVHQCASDSDHGDVFHQWTKTHSRLYRTAIVGEPVSAHLSEVRQFCQDCVRKGGVGDSCVVIPFCMIREQMCSERWGPSSDGPLHHVIKLCREVAQVEIEEALAKFQWAGRFAREFGVSSQLIQTLTTNGWDVDVKVEDIGDLSSLSKAVAHGGVVAVNLISDVTVLGGPLTVPAQSLFVIVGQAPVGSFEGFQLIAESIRRDRTVEATVQRRSPMLDAASTGRIFVVDENATLIAAGLKLRGALGSAVCARKKSSIQVWGSTLEDNHAPFGMDTSIPGCPAEVGGAIYCGGCNSLLLMGSHFNGNSAGAGGAVFATGYGKSYVQNSTFSRNWATAGGGLYLHNSDWKSACLNFKLKSTTEGKYQHTTCRDWSAEFPVWEKTGGSTTLDSSKFLDGYLEEVGGMQAHWVINQRGGGAYVLQLTGGQDCLGCLPTLLPHGGCVAAVDLDSFFVEHTQFRGCKALPPDTSVVPKPSFPFRMGGALFLQDAMATLHRSVLADNVASVGGGICVQKATTKVINSTIAGNMATADGGGVFAIEGKISVDRAAIMQNQANNSGGGFVAQGVTMVMERTNIADNLAPHGGGGAILGGRAELKRVVFARNMRPSMLKITEYDGVKHWLRGILELHVYTNWTGSGKDLGDADLLIDKGAWIVSKGVQFEQNQERIAQNVWSWLDLNMDGIWNNTEQEKVIKDAGFERPQFPECPYQGCFDFHFFGASAQYKEAQMEELWSYQSYHQNWENWPNGGQFRVALMNGATWTAQSFCPEGTAEPFPQSVVPFHVDSGDAGSKGGTEAWKSPVVNYVLNISDCFECPPGTYNSKPGAVAEDAEGSGACVRCPAGSASNTSRATQSSVCTTCPAGRFAPEGSPQCFHCPPGTSKGNIGQRACPCAKGFVLQNCDGPCLEASLSRPQDLVCPEGWLSWQTSCYLKHHRFAKTYDEASSMCQELQGHLVIVSSAEEQKIVNSLAIEGVLLGLREVDGNANKSVDDRVWKWPDGTCAPPTNLPNENCSAYSNWMAGEPNNHGGKERLVFAWTLTTGMWNDFPEEHMEGAEIICERPSGKCLQCSDPRATTASVGSSSLDDCLCREETFLRSDVGCSMCQEGLKCPGLTNAPPLQMEGFMVDVIDAEKRDYSVYRCLNPARCPEGPVGTCNGGAMGLMCLDCPQKPRRHFWKNDESGNGMCVDCSESPSNTWVMPVAILMLATGMSVVFRSSLPKDGREQLSAALEVAVSLGLFLVMAQTCSVFGRMIIPWGSPLDKILEFCRFFALDLNILQLDCVVGMSYVDRFILGSLLPLIGMAVYGLVAALLLKLGWGDAKLRAINSIGLITQALFIGFLLHGIEPFLVFSHPNGEKSMLAGPEVLVGSHIHNQLVMLGVIHIAFYGIGFLSFCLFACSRIWLRARSGQARGVKGIMWFRFLYFKFVPQRYYWGVVHLVRASLIALTPVIFESPHMQIVLLTIALTSFACLQCYFWPYRSNLHNILDVSVHGAMISLCSAAAFFLPTEGEMHGSIVKMVLSALLLCGLSFVIVLFIPVTSEVHARCFQTKEQREQSRRKIRAQERLFTAELQKSQENDLFGAEEVKIDIEPIISMKPRLDAHNLVQVLSGTEPKEVEDISILLPLEHSEAQTAANALNVYERKLRWRAQEFFDAAGSSLEKKQKLEMRHYSHGFKSPVAWTKQEAGDVEKLIDFVQRFILSYSSTLLADTKSLHVLKVYMMGMQAKFRGVYQACVRDLLQKESGFHAVVGLGTFLQKEVADETKNPAPIVPEDKHVMYVRAVMTQELLMSYVADLGGATQGRTPKKGATKHLWRVTEKGCLDPNNSKTAVYDVARTLVEYDTMQSLAVGLEHLKADHDKGKIRILRVKERFSQPTSGGWSDILVNICFLSKDPQVQALPCEIQFVHSQLMLIRQEMGAHGDYSKFRVACEIVELHESKTGRAIGSSNAAEWEVDLQSRERTADMIIAPPEAKSPRKVLPPEDFCAVPSPLEEKSPRKVLPPEGFCAVLPGTIEQMGYRVGDHASHTATSQLFQAGALARPSSKVADS